MFDNVTPVYDYEHSLKLRHFLQENQTFSMVLSTSGKKKGLLAYTLFNMDLTIPLFSFLFFIAFSVLFLVALSFLFFIAVSLLFASFFLFRFLHHITCKCGN